VSLSANGPFLVARFTLPEEVVGGNGRFFAVALAALTPGFVLEDILIVRLHFVLVGLS
jgi:hypothetical protein